MIKLFQRLSIQIVIIIYALSALEINACGIENTFFDEFDTYIESKTQKIESTAVKEKKNDRDSDSLELGQHYFIVFDQQYFYSFLITPTYQKHKSFVQTRIIWQRKLFVFHSSFLI